MHDLVQYLICTPKTYRLHSFIHTFHYIHSDPKHTYSWCIHEIIFTCIWKCLDKSKSDIKYMNYFSVVPFSQYTVQLLLPHFVPYCTTLHNNLEVQSNPEVQISIVFDKHLQFLSVIWINNPQTIHGSHKIQVINARESRI